MGSDNISDFNDSLRSGRASAVGGGGDRKFKNAEIFYNEEQSGICDEIICEEQRLIQVLMCLLLKILKITIRAQIEITADLDDDNQLVVQIREKGNIFGKD